MQESKFQEKQFNEENSRYFYGSFDKSSEMISKNSSSKVYPPLISELIKICLKEYDQVKEALKERNRLKYKNIYESYKQNLTEKDSSIIRGSLYYLYDNSRVNPIDKETTLRMISINEIPSSQIVKYTKKEILQSLAKELGLSCYSNKKSQDLIEYIRSVIDPVL